jgi:3-oxoacyl-[acyl-carrier protein] reductase
MSRLSEKVAIVTGASKGIGAGIATAFGGAGARVAVNYSSDREGAERVAQAITDNGGEAIAVGADVSKAADVARLFKEVDSAFGRLDAREVPEVKKYSPPQQTARTRLYPNVWRTH